MLPNSISEKIALIISKWQNNGENNQDRSFLCHVGENCVWSYGITQEGIFCFFLESSIHLGCGRQLCTKSIQCIELKNDDSWILQFGLMELGDISIFALLVEDLISESINYKSDDRCVHSVVERFVLWKSMLSNAAEHKSEEKGLWGELFTLKCLLSVMEPIDAVRSWMGPEYEAQDYKFANKWIEVKTVGSNAFAASINSIKQLIGANTGYLYVILADEDELSEEAVTVHGIYCDICEVLKTTSKDALELFNDKIREFKLLGFVAKDNTRYLYKGERQFEVREDFPRLIIHGDALAIGKVKYDLKLDTLKEWEINDLWQNL